MRFGTLTIAIAFFGITATNVAWAQDDTSNLAAAFKAFGQAAQMRTIPRCTSPNGMGLSRVVEIDTSGGPGFGFRAL